MSRVSTSSSPTCRQPMLPVLGFSRNSSGYALLALLSLLALSGCAATPQCRQQEVVPPGPDLMKPPPKEGYFRRHLDRILDPSYTGTPTSPTN